MLRLSFFVSLIFTFTNIIAQSETFGYIDKNLWPYPVSTKGEFDFASKIHMLVFISHFAEIDRKLNEDSLRVYAEVETVSLPSVFIWKRQVQDILQKNFENLPPGIPHDNIMLERPLTWTSLVKASANLDQKLPEKLKPWLEHANDYMRRYFHHLVKAACLFPQQPSEILKMDTVERNGFEMPDRQFLLSFNSSSDSPHSESDKILSYLNVNNYRAVFFCNSSAHDKMYGKNLCGTLLKTTYEAKTKKGKAATPTSPLLKFVSGRMVRPYMAQRDEKLIELAKKSSSKIILWNIDSKDWHKEAEFSKVADHVIAQCLLWRKGIILFHDHNPYFVKAMPVIERHFQGCGISFNGNIP